MNYATTPLAHIRQMISNGELDELHAELLTGDAESYPTLMGELAVQYDPEEFRREANAAGDTMPDDARPYWLENRQRVCLDALDHDLSL